MRRKTRSPSPQRRRTRVQQSGGAENTSPTGSRQGVRHRALWLVLETGTGTSFRNSSGAPPKAHRTPRAGRGSSPAGCGAHLQERNTHVHTETYTPKFIAASLTTAKVWKQPQCPPTSERINRKGSTPERTTAQRGGNELPTRTRHRLGVLLNGRSQIQRQGRVLT